MANVIRRRGASPSPSDRRNEGTRKNSKDGSGSGWRVFFLTGDFAFLVCVGVAATVAAHMVHALEWAFVPTCLLSMGAAMAAQIVLSVMASPILGSIESMVPSMIVAMASPMAICAFHLAGQEPSRSMAIVVGGVVAMGMFVFVQIYGRSCVSSLRKERAKVT